MYVSTYTYIMFIYVYTYTCVCTCLYKFIFVYACLHVYTYMQSYLYLCLYMYMYMHAHMHMCRYLYIYIYIYLYMYLYIRAFHMTPVSVLNMAPLASTSMAASRVLGKQFTRRPKQVLSSGQPSTQLVLSQVELSPTIWTSRVEGACRGLLRSVAKEVQAPESSFRHGPLRARPVAGGRGLVGSSGASGGACWKGAGSESTSSLVELLFLLLLHVLQICRRLMNVELQTARQMNFDRV